MIQRSVSRCAAIAFLCLIGTVGAAPRPAAAVQVAGRLLVNLDARDASAATATWKNSAERAIGDFARLGEPKVETVGGQVAVVLSGRGDAWRGPDSPAALNGAHVRSIEVWVYKGGRIGAEETMVGWGVRGQPLENFGFNYGTATGYGALTTYAGDMGWGTVPPTGAWHDLAFVFDGRMATIYDNGVLCGFRDFPPEETMNTAAGYPIMIGAQNQADGGNSMYFSGAIALVRIMDGALTADQIKHNFEEDAARFGAVAPPASPTLTAQMTAATTTPPPPVASKAVPVTKVTRRPDGALLAMQPGAMQLQVWSDRTIRVTYAPQAQLPELRSFSVIGKPAITKWTLRETPDAVIIETPALRARIDRKSGAVGFFNIKGNPILRETDDGKVFAPSPDRAVDTTLVHQSFVLEPTEAIYGLGQHQSGAWDYRGTTVHLQQRNMDVALPVLVSSKGYGVLWDNPAVSNVAVGAPSHPGLLGWTSEVGKAIDYYFMYGPTADGVIQDYRRLTGEAPLMGEWAWGFWQCKEHYASQQELIDVVKRYRELGVPLDGIIQDWQYWPRDGWGSHEFDPARYPDPAGMVRELHDLHTHLLISVWAKFDPGSKNYDELERAGALYTPVIPSVYPSGRQKWYDPFSAAGRRIYWKQVADRLFSLGIDGWWLDATEPELGGHWGEFRTYQTADGPGATVFNAYPLETTSGIYDSQRAQTEDKRVFILTRSAYPGQQRNAAVTWSGDINGNWRTLARQIPAGLNFSLSGIPYWNTDIGGFFSGNPRDQGYQELFTRWFQFGAFCPMFRVHGTNFPKELWRWPEATQKIMEDYIQLRYRLLPYTYSVSWQVTHDSGTMMRPLAMDFADDKRALQVGDQYLFGPAIMVNPVTEVGATKRSVYLPGRGEWYDFWTGQKERGGRTVDAAAPIQTEPLYVRAGSIVPLGLIVQYVGEKPEDPIELRVYRGAHGAFTLYEDDGNTYAYEKGARATVPITWNEAAGTLTIGAREGNFPGMLSSRTFRVVFVDKGHGVGLAETGQADQVVKYSGKAVLVKGRLGPDSGDGP